MARIIRQGSVPALLCALVLVGASSSVRAGVVGTPGGVRFTHAAPGAGGVFLAGSFNDWSTTATAMSDEGGVWSVVVHLEAGTHEYKFVVDGEWLADPEHPGTAGEYGNSVVQVGTDGRVGTGAAAVGGGGAAPRAMLSPKVALGGRIASLYESRSNPDNGGRYELRRPGMDADLLFTIAMNDVMEARILTNIHNEAENVEAWRTRMHFDRGSLTFDTGRLSGVAWDNDRVAAWESALPMVGRVGIYDHDFGYGMQGALLGLRRGDARVRILYADNFSDGGYSGPAPGDLFENPENYAVLSAGGWRFPAPEVASYGTAITSGDEDVLALRADTRWRGMVVGLSGRMDRGYNPGALSLVDRVERDPVGFGPPVWNARLRTWGTALEDWRAGGLDLFRERAWGALSVRAEAQWGVARVRSLGMGEESAITLTTRVEDEDSLAVITTVSVNEDPAEEVVHDIDRSRRWFLGLGNPSSAAGFGWEASVRGEDHSFTHLTTGVPGTVTNRSRVWRLDLDRESAKAGWRTAASLEFEYHDFSYSARSPWTHQFWFSERNFWLEHGEHEVTPSRLVLLGGNDAVFYRPKLAFDVVPSHRVRFEYEGTIASHGLNREPKFVETLLRLEWPFADRWRFLTDARFVRYLAPDLGLDGSWGSGFWEVAYQVSPRAELALSFGVDPQVIDPVTNEYDSIGRDRYLFERGATGSTARDAYLSLGEVIPAAESALERARVIQLEAVVEF
ncbi:MAG: glycogen-binding domain-containing protein [Gemmatimonadota bacterium]|nr:glycogen-binding domain-containing protein [Gemmatimonadota bacterium]